MGAGGGSSGGELCLGRGWAVGVCGWCTCTAVGFNPNLWGAVGPLDVRGGYVYIGLDSPEDTVCSGGGGSASCIPLDTGGMGTCLVSREGCLEIWGSKLSCNWGVPGKLANLSAAEVIACSTDHSSSLTLAVSSSDLLLSLSGVFGFSVSEVLELSKCTVWWLRYFHLWWRSER
jgi:hypothetical protein